MTRGSKYSPWWYNQILMAVALGLVTSTDLLSSLTEQQSLLSRQWLKAFLVKLTISMIRLMYLTILEIQILLFKYIGVFYWPALLQLSPALSVISPSYKDLLSGFKWRLFAADKLGEEGGTLKRNAFCVSSLLTSVATSIAVQSHNWRRWWFFYFFHSISGNLVRRETVTLILAQIRGLYHNFLEKKTASIRFRY